MSVPNPNPDLEDSINVTEAHGRITRDLAASAREKKITDNGREPISLWVIVAGGVAAMFAGGILGNGGTLFSYANTFREGYVRTPAPGAADAGAAAKEALAAYGSKGAKLYSAKCNGCHGADARGDGANYPSLAASPWVTGDTERFAMIILNGLQGPTSSGKTYGAGVMPAQGAGMTAEDLACVMTYVRNNFGNSTNDIVTVEMAAAALEISGGRAKVGQPVTAEELAADHAKALPGEPLAPDAMVNPITLQPAPAAP